MQAIGGVVIAGLDFDHSWRLLFQIRALWPVLATVLRMVDRDGRKVPVAEAVSALRYVSSSTPSDGLLDVRRRYVVSRGWLPDTGSDVDRYDADPSTVHVEAMSDSGGLTVAGCRLTPLRGVDGSLTWEMMTAFARRAAEREQERCLADLADVASRGLLWDVTRLVTNDDAGLPHRVLARATYGVLAWSWRVTGCVPGTCWLFATTPELMPMVRRMTSQFYVLASGDVAGDGEDTFLCAVFPGRSQVAAAHGLAAEAADTLAAAA